MAGWFKSIRDRLFGVTSDWQYRKEVLPELGKVDAIYLDEKLLWYYYRKEGIILEINCQVPGGREAGIKVATSITPADIRSHLEKAIQCVPEEEIKAFNFAAGKWEMERIIINSESDFVLELGNSNDRDHCCRVIWENGRYEFEMFDG